MLKSCCNYGLISKTTQSLSLKKKKSKTIFSRSQIAFKISLMKEVNYITVLCKCSQHENKRSQMEQSIKTF